MLNHSRPHIRKRAILAMYRVFEKHPQIIQNARPRLEDKLDDSDPGILFPPAVLRHGLSADFRRRRGDSECPM